MVAGQVDCGDGAGWCKISMGWSMMEYAHIACGLESMFQGHGDDGLEVDTCDDVDSAGFQASWAKVWSVRLNLSPNKFNCT